MDNSVFGLMDLIIVVCGGYVIYQYILMVQSGKLRENMLISKELNIKKCKDPAGYIKEIGMKQFTFGIVSIACGVVGLIQDFVMTISVWVYVGTMVLFLVTTAWYCIALRKAQKKYWGK